VKQQIGPSNLGRVLVDTHGKTLYLWAHDEGSKSTCYGDCAEYWPPLVTRGNPNALAGAKQSLLGTTKCTDGSLQVTYAGHPLYYFVQDTKAGQTSQVKGLRQAFNSWIVTGAGFFGKGTKATLPVYAVNGTAPALITGKEKPISNVVRETFTIAA
jgi:predicted lipoprotein with Yx(FWY)xxD motif